MIVAGSFRTRTWTDADSGERLRLEVLPEEIRPSLRWATTTVTETDAP